MCKFAPYYDPTIGRFISRDSYEGDISNPLSINQYTYCKGNPLIYVDPTGHREEPYLYLANQWGIPTDPNTPYKDIIDLLIDLLTGGGLTDNDSSTIIDQSDTVGTLTVFAHENHSWIAYTRENSNTVTSNSSQ